MGGHRSRKTVLFVNELYVDLWPASPLGAIAKALDGLAREQELDLSIVFALRDPVFAGFPIAALGYHVLPSPATPTTDHAGTKDNSFADVLLACRFARVHDLSRAVSAWDGLFEVIKPDVIVADTSPVVMLAARGRIPVMVTGSGFAVPPPGLGAFPPFGEDTSDETIQGLMLEVANMVLATRNAPLLDRLPRLLEGEARSAFCVPKLDPYAGTRTEPPLRPCGCPGPLPFPAAPLLFAQMASDQAFAGAAARGFDRAGIAVAAYLPGPETAPTTFLAALGAELCATPPAPQEMLCRASIVVSGDVWLAQAAYTAGRAQICLPSSLEMRLLAEQLEILGCGITLRSFGSEELASAVRELMLNPTYRERAEEEALAAAEWAPNTESAKIVARRCLELVGR
jgi:rhamnosyltransferase subunit B